mmetsp:Transcript_11825/g.26852  ORF Transcript_11825/g.26852 Transcript_11825/m.26852 type:complete len:307 (-) Transcript_11825:690-1610(-)
MKQAVLVLDDHCLVVGKFDKFTDLSYLLVRTRHKELLVSHQTQLPCALVADQHSMLIIHLNSLPLPTIEKLVVWAKENLIRSSYHPDVSGCLIQDLHILAHLQIQGLHLAVVQQLFLCSWKNCGLAAMSGDFASHSVHEPNILVCLENPRLSDARVLGRRQLHLPGGLQEKQSFALLHPAAAIGNILHFHILVFLQGQGVFGIGGLFVRSRKPHAWTLDHPFLAVQFVLHNDVVGVAQADCRPCLSLLMRTREPNARPLLDSTLSRQVILNQDVISTAEADASLLHTFLLRARKPHARAFVYPFLS